MVVYLRTIFHPDGFTFPMSEVFWSKQLLLTEIGREISTMVLIFSGAWLFGQNCQQRVGYFLIIFAIWDIFYYVWLKVLINWPVSIMDWDMLFLVPMVWASPVLAPVLVSVTLLGFAIMILYRCSCEKPIKVTLPERLGFFFAAVVVVVSFCIAGQHIAEPSYQLHFYWTLFTAGLLSAIALFVRCLLR